MFRLIDTLLFTLERLRQHSILVLWVLVGMAVATTLALSMPLYVDSVYSGILQSRLAEPPYAYRYRYLGAWNGNINPVDVQAAGAAIETAFAQAVGLPVAQSVVYVRGGTWQARLANPGSQPRPLGNTFGISQLTGAEPQMQIVAGAWPPPAPADPAAPVPVLIPETMLYRTGIQIGDTLQAARPGGRPVTLTVAALWRPNNPADPAWIFPPKFFDDIFIAPPGTLATLLEGIDRPVDEVAWWLIFDGSRLRTAEVDGLLSRMIDGQRQVQNALPGIRIEVSPEEGLKRFNDEVNALTTQLFIIIMPVGGLVLYFVSLVAGLLVSRQQPEDVKLRSRGMSRRAVMTVHVLMWLLIVGMALAVGLVASPAVVRLIGQTASFLNFNGVNSVTDVVLTGEALAIGVLTGLVAASSGLLLAWRTTLQNINSFKRQSTAGGRAWWQRAYLDLMLLVPAVYVLYSLQQQNGVRAGADTPFSDPVTFLGPTLFALGMTLLFLRLLPVLLAALARLLSVTADIELLMALRELTRSAGRYRGALLMMAFTLSLTGFTASMASTLDRSLVDSVNYRIGAELVLVAAADAQTEAQTNAATGTQTLTVTGYNPPPVRELEQLPGIAGFSRVGRYEARLQLRGRQLQGVVLGIDRAALAAVTRYREDYSDVPLANMMNDLAGRRTGVVISRQTAVDNGLLIGQEIEFQVNALGEWQNALRAPIVGVIDYFPTLNPADGFFLLTSLDPIFEMAGSALPFNIWLTLAPGATVAQVQREVAAIGFPVLRWLSPAAALAEAQAQPARRGVLGFLSVGFVAAIMLTLIGAVIQSVSSFRAQAAQLGSLRAMGLSGSSVLVYMILLQGLSAASGILSGTTIGVATTLLFLPLLDFSGGLPPYLVRVAWDEIILVYALFAGVLFFVTLFVSLLLSREQLATIVRLGEA
ncbi:MAG: ABC transporter permease [Anaerolineae bacterium]|jgi:putative ABC transport system permease protein|nr:ABC transporter permease [Anaerolineae bacterium]